MISHQYTKKEYAFLIREMRRVQRDEEKFLDYDPSKAKEDKAAIRERIPEKAYNALQTAFEKAFSIIFNKGGSLIEKTGSIEKARRKYDELRESLDLMILPGTLRAIDKNASSRVVSGRLVGTADGTIQGLLGSGIPDIPIFLGLLLKQCYEIGASYGCDYRDPKERRFTTCVLKFAFCEPEKRAEYSQECDDLAGIMERGEEYDADLSDGDIHEISSVLAGGMLVAKFIQGMTFIGVVGGAFNYSLMGRVSKAARLKYKKRFLYRYMLKAREHVEEEPDG